MLPRMEVVIALGANLGDREQHLLSARSALEADPDFELIAASDVYETEPVGPPQPRYLNAALLVRTALSPDTVLERCLGIERSLGQRSRRALGSTRDRPRSALGG